MPAARSATRCASTSRPKTKSFSGKNRSIPWKKSVEYTQELLTLGTSTYLEVLTAQQSLLSAQASNVSDQFDRIQAIVNLYNALGGGRNE